MNTFDIHKWQSNFRKKQLLNEDTFAGRGSDLATAYQSVIELSAEEMEELLEALAGYFKDNAEELSNFDARGVANHLESASQLISRRTGN